MNEHDSLRIKQQLLKSGMLPALDPSEADLIVVNSCSVRSKPEHKAISETGRYRNLRKSRGTRIVLAGCVAKQKGKELLQKAPYLDAVIGPDQIFRISELIEEIFRGGSRVIAVREHDEKNPCFVPLGPVADQNVSTTVTIMKGCNNYCSYCIVPYVRGREVSRPMKEILHEVENLSRRGYREIQLLGQNVNSYLDLEGNDFPKLLTCLDRQALVDRIRFTTSHPKDVNQRLADTMNDCKRVCEHIHLGLQSGSDRILKLMNRHYTRREFIEKIELFRSTVENISITTDIIVGFPNETDGDFEQTLEVVQACEFEQAFSFKYSPRPQTQASKLCDDVSEECKADRLSNLQELLIKLEKAGLGRLVGGRREVLVEGPSVRDKNAYMGRTRCNRVVNFKTDQMVKKADRVNVQILEVRGHTLWGDDLNRIEKNSQQA